ncbi:MAG: hypothetical protein IKN08_06875 [Bacteroidales bacterium]|nr:hypothetical protein [Bacteroidales bacterium]
MRRIAICLCLLLSFCLYSCQDSAESQARKEALKVRQFQLKVLKETEANPEKSTARFRIGDKDVAVYKGMTMEEVKKHCGEPDWTTGRSSQAFIGALEACGATVVMAMFLAKTRR